MIIKDNLFKIIFFLFLSFGVVFGCYIGLIMPESMEYTLQNSVSVEYQKISWSMITDEMLNAIKLYILGLSFIGIPFLYLSLYMNGVGFGFSILCYIVSQQWDSIFSLIIFGILPQLFSMVPLSIMLWISIKMSKNLFFSYRNIFTVIFRYTILMILCMIACCFCNLLQYLLYPLL